uniref:Calponin-homology (CH) domain-containing protein n=1 Tax=Lotharella oceanica TaxID=641309 RepID=A0A7S2TZU8_9EUKA
MLLLQLIDSLQPGVVDWALVHREPRRRVQCVLNCALMLELLDRKLGFRCPDVSARNIADAEPRAVRSVIGKLMNWDLLRCALRECPPLAGRTVVGVANMLVEWHIDNEPQKRAQLFGGAHVTQKPMTRRMRMPTTCDDPSLAHGLWLLALVEAVIAAGPQRMDSECRKDLFVWLTESSAGWSGAGSRGVQLCACAIAAAQVLGVQSLIGPEDVLHGRCDLIRAFMIELIALVPRQRWPPDPAIHV